MGRADSLAKTLMLQKSDSRKRRGRQRMRIWTVIIRITDFNEKHYSLLWHSQKLITLSKCKRKKTPIQISSKWKVLFNSVNIIKERLRNCHKLEEINETWCLNAISYPSLILEQKKGIIRKGDVYAQQNNLLSVIYLILPYDINLLAW